jgi:hypothetical protein
VAAGRLRRGALLAISAVWLLSTALWLQPGVIKPDGAGYLVYLPSAWLDGDLLFYNEWQRLGMVARDGTTMFRGTSASDHLGIHWAAGAAVAWLPPFIAADAARAIAPPLQRFPRNGVSLPYNVAIVAMSAAAGLATLLIGFVIARRFTAEGAAAGACIAVWLGTPLLWYSVRHATLSHAVSGAACALFVLLALRLRNAMTTEAVFSVGLALGFAAAVRVQNVALAPVVLIVLEPAARREVLRRAHWLIAGGLLGVLPEVIASQVLYGSPIAFAGFGARVTLGVFRRFWFSETLFSWFHGAFPWTPLVALAVCGLLLVLRSDRRLAIAGLYAFLIQWLLNATLERAFWSGVSFGNRRFDSCTIFFIIGLAALLARFPRSGAAAAALCCAWTMALFFAAGRLDLNFDQTPSELIAAMGPPKLAPLAFVPPAAKAHVAALAVFTLLLIFAIAALLRRARPHVRAAIAATYLGAVSLFFAVCGVRDGSRKALYRDLIEKNRAQLGQTLSDIGLLRAEERYLRRQGKEEAADVTAAEAARLEEAVRGR